MDAPNVVAVGLVLAVASALPKRANCDSTSRCSSASVRPAVPATSEGGSPAGQVAATLGRSVSSPDGRCYSGGRRAGPGSGEHTADGCTFYSLIPRFSCCSYFSRSFSGCFWRPFVFHFSGSSWEDSPPLCYCRRGSRCSDSVSRSRATSASSDAPVHHDFQT